MTPLTRQPTSLSHGFARVWILGALISLLMFCAPAGRAEDAPAKPASAAEPVKPAAPAKPVKGPPDTSDDALGKLLKAGGEKAGGKSQGKKSPEPGEDEEEDGAIEEDKETDDDLDDEATPKAGKKKAAPKAQAAEEAEDDDALLDNDTKAEEAADDEAVETAEQALVEAAADLDEEGKQARKSFTPAQQKIFDKEMAKKRAAVRTAKADLETAKAESARLSTELATAKEAPIAPPAPTKENPLAHLTTQEALDAHLVSVLSWRRWCQLNPEGGNAGTEEKPVEISAEKVRAYLADSEAEIYHAPRQAAFIRDQATSEAQAMTLHPWLKNPHAEQSVQLKAILRANPQWAAIPGYKLILADHIAHSQARKAAAAKPALPPLKKTAVARAITTPGSSPRPPLMAGQRQASTRATTAFRRTGQDPDNAALIAALNGRG